MSVFLESHGAYTKSQCSSIFDEEVNFESFGENAIPENDK